VRILEFFQEHKIEFASVCEQFSTNTPVGRFTLGILMGVAQLERENISQRTQAKIMATRRRGLWTGGPVPLGYDLVEKQLVLNEKEAEQAREVFRLYINLGSILAVAEEANRRGWTTKTWTMQSGEVKQGKPFNKITVRNLITNPVYTGKVKLNGELFDGVQPAIINEKEWRIAQEHLKRNGMGCRPRGASKSGALLLGLVQCACGSGMSVHTARKRSKVYSSYVCIRYMKEGAASCRGSRVPTRELESFVLDKVMAIGRDPQLVTETIKAARRQLEAKKPEILAELRYHEKDREKLDRERRHLVDAVGEGKASPAILQRLGEQDLAAQSLEEQVAKLKDELAAIESKVIDEDELRAALGSFTPIWEELFPAERARILQLLIERVTYDAKAGEVEIVFRPGGVRTLADEGGKA